MPQSLNVEKMRFQDYPRLSNADLVSMCINKDRDAWNEFFRRYDHEIERAIIKTLRRTNYYVENQDYYQDIVYEIKEPVIVKLYRDKGLEGCDHPERVKAWLWKIAINKTVDWLKQRNAVKNIPKRFIEDTLLSLYTPLNEDEDIILIDKIEDDYESGQIDHDEALKNIIDDILKRIEEIDNIRAYWTLKLSLIAHIPLTDKNILALAEFNGMPVEDVQKKLVEIYKYVDKKIQKKEKNEAKAITLGYRILRLQALSKIAGKEGFSQKQTELEAEIMACSVQRKDCITQSQIVCRPSNMDIGLLVGLPIDKVNQVTNILIRIRDSLSMKAGYVQED